MYLSNSCCCSKVFWQNLIHLLRVSRLHLINWSWSQFSPTTSYHFNVCLWLPEFLPPTLNSPLHSSNQTKSHFWFRNSQRTCRKNPDEVIRVHLNEGAWSLPANTALDGCIARPVRHFRRCLQLAAAKGKFQLEKSTPSFLLPCKSRLYHQVWMLLRSTFSPWAKADLCFKMLLSSEDSMRQEKVLN